MLDFNTIITAAITAAITNAVETATAPLKEQIATLTQEMAKLSTQPQMDPALLATALNDQEWFWAKIADFVDRDINNYDFSHVISMQLNRIGLEDYLDPDKLQELISDAVSDSSAVRKAVKDAAEHYINEEFDMEDAVLEAVKGLTFDVSVS